MIVSSAPDPVPTFHEAIEALERQLDAGHWDRAGEAAEALSAVCAHCEAAGVALSPEQLAAARASFERCVGLAVSWGQKLHAEAQSSRSSTKAHQIYSRG